MNNYLILLYSGSFPVLDFYMSAVSAGEAIKEAWRTIKWYKVDYDDIKIFKIGAGTLVYSKAVAEVMFGKE